MEVLEGEGSSLMRSFYQCFVRLRKMIREPACSLLVQQACRDSSPPIVRAGEGRRAALESCRLFSPICHLIARDAAMTFYVLPLDLTPAHLDLAV
jgi:hypothetical protein